MKNYLNIFFVKRDLFINWVTLKWDGLTGGFVLVFRDWLSGRSYEETTSKWDWLGRAPPIASCLFRVCYFGVTNSKWTAQS